MLANVSPGRLSVQRIATSDTYSIMVMLPAMGASPKKKRSKTIWQKKENVLNVCIAKEIGVRIGVGIVVLKEPM